MRGLRDWLRRVDELVGDLLIQERERERERERDAIDAMRVGGKSSWTHLDIGDPIEGRISTYPDLGPVGHLPPRASTILYAPTLPRPHGQVELQRVLRRDFPSGLLPQLLRRVFRPPRARPPHDYLRAPLSIPTADLFRGGQLSRQ